MREIASTFRKLEKELVQLMGEKCKSESDIRCQELRLKQINTTIKRIGAELKKEKAELKQRQQALKQRHARLLN